MPKFFDLYVPCELIGKFLTMPLCSAVKLQEQVSRLVNAQLADHSGRVV
jgi:hypothetical protein